MRIEAEVGWAPRVPDGRGIERYFVSYQTESDMLNIGLVGCGKIADAHASQIRGLKRAPLLCLRQ